MDSNRDFLYAIYGKNTFLKVKPALGIGKILFAFVDRASKTSIDCYINLLDYEELLDSIKTRYLQKKIEAEKAKGDKYPKAVWETPLGGSTKKGKTIYRKFSIAPGASQYAVFTAECGPAIDQDGKCVPVKKNKDNEHEFKIIRVGIMNYEEFRKMMLESEKYLRVWYEAERNKELLDELRKMMQRPTNNETLLEGEEEPGSAEVPKETPKEPPKETPKKQINEQPITTAPQIPANGEPPTVVKGMFRSKNHIQNCNTGMYLYACRKTDAEPVPVLFLQDRITKVDQTKWTRLLKDLTEKTDVTFSIMYCEKGGKLYFTDFA